MIHTEKEFVAACRLLGRLRADASRMQEEKASYVYPDADKLSELKADIERCRKEILGWHAFVEETRAEALGSGKKVPPSAQFEGITFFEREELVVDAHAIPRQYCCPDMAAIKAALADGVKIKGVSKRNVTSMRVK